MAPQRAHVVGEDLVDAVVISSLVLPERPAQRSTRAEQRERQVEVNMRIDSSRRELDSVSSALSPKSVTSLRRPDGASRRCRRGRYNSGIGHTPKTTEPCDASIWITEDSQRTSDSGH
jgi:hypothetical protein